MKYICLALFLAGCVPARRPFLVERAAVAPYDVRALEWRLTSIQYWPDVTPADEFRPCAATWREGFGDCDDYAQCAFEFTQTWPNCERRRIIYESAPYKYHAVLFLKCADEKIFGYFDNGVFRRGLPNFYHPLTISD